MVKVDGDDHDWDQPGTSVSIVTSLESWQGTTDAIVRCARCGQYAEIRLVWWQGRHLEDRMFAVIALDDTAATRFLKDLGTRYCDLERHAAELDALRMSGGAPIAVFTTRLPEFRVLGTPPVSILDEHPIVSWQQLPRSNEVLSGWMPIHDKT